MAVVKKLSITNIRSHDSFNIIFSEDTTVITGKNGSGKTSLLESIFINLQGSSFKGSDVEVLKHGGDWWRIEVVMDDGVNRIVTYNPKLPSGRKKFVIDDKTTYRLSPKYKYPIVLFEPDDLRLLNGSPVRRRHFIDGFIGQLDPTYQTSLHKYERALKQRNNLLKKPHTTRDELFVWNIALSEYGSQIIEKRTLFIEQINNQINEAYGTIAKTDDIVSIHYSHTYIGDIKQKLLNDLDAHIEKDKTLGFTSIGPHRHDVIFGFNDSPALSVASRGEIRSIILALKFLEIGIIEKLTDQKPIILLDDVFSELDEYRQNQLINTNNQTIITTTQTPKNMKKSKIVKLT